MCQQFPHEAVKTNIVGTMNVVRAAKRSRIRTVLVSTDKAVKPTTVMGATKTAAEAITARVRDNIIVRLVNIWGSRGSLKEVLERQVREGHPIELRHAEMQRYFQPAEHAAQLLLDAAEMPRGHKAALHFPKDMEPRLIADVIREVCTELGQPDYPVMITDALLPGEKLIEELCTVPEKEGRPVRPNWMVSLMVNTLASMALDVSNSQALRDYVVSVGQVLSHD